MDKTSLGNRMKAYESNSKQFLTRRTPLIIRLDGKAFHSLTKKMDKPYDIEFKDIMLGVSEFLLENIMGCKLAYVQSDEISLLLVDYEKIESEPWFNNNLQKIVSVSASLATAKFNDLYSKISEDKRIKDFGFFDSRAFILPKEEVVNYFIWRQQDASRNSIQGLGQANFSNKQMHGKNNSKVQDMLMLDKGINWNDVDTYFKRGGCVYRGVESRRITESVGSSETAMETVGYEYKQGSVFIDNDIPIFTKDRDYVQVHVDCSVERLMNRAAVSLASTILEETDNETFSSIELVGILKNPSYTTQGSNEEQ